MHHIEIKKAGIADLKIIQVLGRQTFYESFSAENTAENMQRYLDENFSTEKLSQELNNPDSAFYLAHLANDAIGYIKVNTGEAQTELKNKQAMELERIYVSRQFQGKQIGKLLFDKALQLAIEMKAPYLWLGVWERNTKAIQFYKKNGLVEFDKHIFNLGDDEQTDLLMKMDL